MAAATFALAAALPATAASRIVPAQPTAFELVNLRMTVDSCAFNPSTVHVRAAMNMWWNPLESGWGVSLHQNALHSLFGAWFVYGPGGEPEWYTLQGGRWVDSTTWRGTVYRTTGPFFAGPDFDPRLVLVQAAGTATLDFRHRDGEEGRARFSYTIGGATTTKVIERMRF